MTDRTYNDVPMIECPACGKTFQQDDYYDMKVRDVFECPRCERDLVIEEVQLVWVVTVSRDKSDPPDC